MAKSAKKSQLLENCLPNSRNNGKINMVRNVRAYILNRQEQMQRIVHTSLFKGSRVSSPGSFVHLRFVHPKQSGIENNRK